MEPAGVLPRSTAALASRDANANGAALLKPRPSSIARLPQLGVTDERKNSDARSVLDSDPAGLFSLRRSIAKVCPGRAQRQVRHRALSEVPAYDAVHLGGRVSRVKSAPEFEWTFSTRVRERRCHQCPSMTSGFLTNLRTGVRKPLCSTCFFAALKEFSPNSAPRKQPDSVPSTQIRETEQLRLC
jgi:hypothetical protein